MSKLGAIGVLACWLVAMRAAEAQQPQPQPAPPDPRVEETLDGREEPEDPNRYSYLVPRVILFVPRLAFKIIFFPIVKLAAVVERYEVPARIYWALTSDDETIGVRPQFGFESGRRPMGGLGYFDRRTLGPGSEIKARFKTGGPSLLLGEIKVRPRPVMGMRARFERTDDERFAGIHGETDEELAMLGRGVARYGYDRVLGDVELNITRHRFITFTLRGTFDVHEYENGIAIGTDLPIREVWCSDCAAGIVDEMQVPGFGEGTSRLGAGAELAVDTRKNVRHGTGFVGKLDARWAKGVLGDPSHDVAALADVAQQFDLHDRAFILRVRAGAIEPLGDAPVPFHHLMVASGPEGIRGIGSGQLRGSSMAIASAEYRWLLTPYLDAAIMGDYGSAFDRRFNNFSWDRMRPSVGAGLRFYGTDGPYWTRGLMGGIDVAYTPGESVRVMFSTVD